MKKKEDTSKKIKGKSRHTTASINPDDAVKRGYLQEEYKLFYLNSIEKNYIPAHYHEFHKAIIFISGSLVYMVEGKHFLLNPGDILIIPAYAVHQPIIGENIPYKRYVLWLKQSAADSLGAQELFSSAHILGQEETTIDIDPVISEAIEYINNNLGEDLSVETLTEKYYLSKSRFINRFKNITGYTPHQYITDKRIIKCAQLMQAGANAGDAAARCGFKEYSVFYRAFKKALGVSPRNYI